MKATPNQNQTSSKKSEFDIFEIVTNGTIPDLMLALADGVDVNVKNSEGNTPLMVAIDHNPTSGMIEALVQFGADLEAVGELGTPLNHAISSFTDISVIETLLKLGSKFYENDGRNTHDSFLLASFQAGLLFRKINPLSENYTPDVDSQLIEEVIASRVKIIHLLVDYGLKLTTRDAEGSTKLMDAVGVDSAPQVIKLLIDLGSDVNAKNDKGIPPLFIAAIQATTPETIQILLDAGADTSVTSEGVTALDLMELNEVLRNTDAYTRLASLSSMVDIFELAKTGTNSEMVAAIANGTNINAKGDKEWTPLLFASRYNSDPKVLMTLLNAGAYLEAKGEGNITALMLASSGNPNPEVTQVLLNAGADLEARDTTGSTPLIFASNFNSNPEVIQVLIDAGANLEARDATGWTSLIIASIFNSNPKVIRTLLAAGANLEARDSNGWTPLMHASFGNPSPEAIQILIDAGANHEAQDIKGNTAWDLIQNNENLKGTDAYWQLNDLRFK